MVVLDVEPGTVVLGETVVLDALTIVVVVEVVVEAPATVVVVEAPAVVVVDGPATVVVVDGVARVVVVDGVPSVVVVDGAPSVVVVVGATVVVVEGAPSVVVVGATVVVVVGDPKVVVVVGAARVVVGAGSVVVGAGSVVVGAGRVVVVVVVVASAGDAQPQLASPIMIASRPMAGSRRGPRPGALYPLVAAIFPARIGPLAPSWEAPDGGRRGCPLPVRACMRIPGSQQRGIPIAGGAGAMHGAWVPNDALRNPPARARCPKSGNGPLA